MVKNLLPALDEKGLRELHAYRDEWIALGRSTERLDRKAVADGINGAYMAFLNKPQVPIMYFSSPLVASLAIIALGSQLESQLRSQLGAYWGGSLWSGYYSYFGYAEKLGARGARRIHELLHAWLMCMRATHIWWSFDNVAICSDRPTKVAVDNEGRLHSTNGQAIEYSDGWGISALWGVRFDKDLHEKITSRAVSAAEVLQIKNIEQRMAALEFLGAESVIDALDSELLHKSDKGNLLYSVKGIGDELNYFLKYSCPSTARQYVSFVPPEVGAQKDADAAMAWKFSISKRQYLDMRVET